jgi:TonB family protein
MNDDPRTRGDQPGNRWTLMAIAAGAAVLLALNNPTEADARRYIGERLNAAIRDSASGDTPGERAGASLAIALLAPFVDSALVVERRNLIVASHYTVKPNAFLDSLTAASGESDALGEICLIGVFGRFFPCGAKGKLASQLLDGRIAMPGDGGTTADAVPPPAAADDAVVDGPPPPPPPAPDEGGETTDAPAAGARAAIGYAEVGDVLLAIGVRIRAGEYDAAERRLDEVEQLSLSPEDRAIVANLRQRIASGRRAGAVAARAAPPPASASRVAPRIDVRRSPSTDDFYPAAARQAQIEGKTALRVCVGTDGRVTGEPAVTDSSGTTALDQAAVAWARRARFTPGTEDGNAVEMCTGFRVNFKLTD